MMRHSIQRLHTKFQPNWLKNAVVMHVFHFQGGRLVGRQLVWLVSILKSFISHTYVEYFHLETAYKVSTKLVEKWLSYAHFSLLGRQAGWAGWVGWITKIGQDVKRLNLVQLPTKYEPNRSKHKKVIHFLRKIKTTTITTPTRLELQSAAE